MKKNLISLILTLILLLSAFSASAETEITGLQYESSLQLQYATQYSVDFYEGGYALVDVVDGDRVLIVPEDGEVPEGLDEDITVLQQPIDKIYLAATASMALFDAIDALDAIRMSSVNADGWYVENATAAMNNGDILFAGKYSEPDYELLVNEGCDLAIESTMIFHTPKVKEMIELLGIPVFVDRSSYESHPLGRTEWIKLYGVLTGKLEESEAFFETQSSLVEALEDFENTEKTVAFFYISSDGSVVVRSSSDYVPKMIELAGGRYIFDDITDPESNRSTVSITMEEFYAAAIDADYLIYNATIDDPLSNLDELLAKSDLFEDFKAVKEGNVWCTGKYLYQATDSVGEQISDMHAMLTGADGELNFLYQLK